VEEPFFLSLFEKFRGKKVSRKGQKTAKPRKFLPAKVSDLKVLLLHPKHKFIFMHPRLVSTLCWI